MHLEICKVNNGGCDVNSVCSYDGDKKQVQCTCKPGFTDVDPSPVVVCKGIQKFQMILLRHYECIMIVIHSIFF